MQRLWLVAAGVLVAISGLTATAPPVVTRLRARFSAPPLALELAEAVAAENTTAYFSFLTHVASIGLTDTPESAVYQHALQYVRDEHVFGSPAAVALWEWGMALHTAAPAVEAYYQYYTDTVVPDLNATLPAFDSACPVWVLFNQRQYCGEDAVRQAFPTSPRDNPAHEPKDGQLMIQVSPKRLPFDHIYSASGVGPVTDAAGPTAILYADIAHPAFLPVHQLLLQFATTQPATYIFRPRPPTTSSPQPLYLSGYGVSLRLKSTEYRVIDDEAHQPSTPSQTLAPSDELLQQPAHPVDEASLNEAVPTVNALTKQQIRTLGLLSAQWVLNHTDTLQPQSHALDALAHLTQDFPKYAHRLVLRTFNESLADGVFVLRSSRMQPGIWLNGLPLRHSTIKPLEAFGLLASLRAETQVIDGLLAAGLPLATVHQLLVAPDLNRDPGAYQQHMPTSSKLNDLTRHRVDPFASVVQNEYQVYDVRPSSGQESTVVWWNDLERDAVYSHWPGLGALRRSLYSGGMRRIGKNICSVVFFLDLSSHQGLEILVEDVAVNVMQQVPLRFGIAPLVAPEDAADSSPPTTMAQLFYFITNAYSRAQAVEFFKAILTQKRLEPNTSIVAIARAQFAQWLTLVPLTTDAFNTPKSVVDPWDRMLHTARTMYQDYLEELRRLQERLNLPSPTGHTDGVGFANGKYFDLNDGFRRHVMTIYSLDSVFVTQKYLDGEITDDTNLYDYFLTQATVLMHRNALIFPSATRPLSIRNMVAALDASDEQWVDQVPYLYPLGSTRASPKPVARPWISVWVVGDLSQPMVQADFNEALRHMQADSSVRVAWIPNAFFSQRRQSTTALADSYYEQLLARAAHVSRQLYTDHVWPMVAALSPQASNTTTEAPAPADDSVFSATQYFYPLLSAMLADPAADFTQLVQKVTAQTASEQASPASGHGSHLERLFQQLRGHEDPVDATHVSRVYARIARCSQHALQLHDTDRTLVINARSLGALHESQRMTAQDLAVLVSLEVTKRVGPLFSALQASGVPLVAASTLLEHDQLANQLLKVGSIVFSAGTAHATYPLAEAARVVRTSLTELHAAPELGFTVGAIDSAWFHIQAIVDPVAEETQRWAPLLQTVAQLPRVAIQVHLLPSLNVVTMPLTRFYRYVLVPALRWDTEPTAQFDSLPAEPLLTLALDTLSSWMVTPIASDHDLDNLRLATAAADGPARAIEAMFELKHIMVEGHCVDVTTGYPPRGLQFVLGTAATPALTDTVVMANYGYFQFLAGSGVWNLQLRTGRSQQLYTLENAGNQGWPGEALRDVPTQVVVTSLQGVTIYPKVRKRPGHENESLLVSNQPVSDHQDAQPFALRAPSALFGPHSFWSMAARWVTEQAAQVIPGLQLPVAAQETIHVFSVASGHLYERFLGIMILSVLEHTRHPVKFWFIENFLSPSFKAFIPHMAQHYGFTYQLVTYQWPYWLRQQTEKQRTIWGYKILFLDVLFPLSVDKIIFVDADQVVRADLGELATMDLQGAPYGYVPFCNNRPEMDGFRFWKGGWWQQHLAGKPYHISALYVVDLHRFRQLAAGDRLRQQYQALSQDPNSLANLDQDLPNNMQHDVPIFSLPQEWLWCETWCSDSSLQSAKTIDLCNNPLTKEPKLQRARRLLPEWEKYDQAIQAFKQQLSTTAASPVAVSTTAVPDAGALDHAHEEL